MNNLTVFCSSKNNINPIYFDQTIHLIKLIDNKKFNLAYGGGTTGLMGQVRTTFINNGGKIISSNVKHFVEANVPDDYVFDNIDERQQKLIELGNAYLILPGGYGTYFEMLEVMTKNDIGEASKPIFIFNCNNIFDNFINLIDNLIEEKFITRDMDHIKVSVSDNPYELANMINNYEFV